MNAWPISNAKMNDLSKCKNILKYIEHTPKVFLKESFKI